MVEKEYEHGSKIPPMSSSVTPTSPSTTPMTANEDLDVAFKYIKNVSDGDADFNSVNLAALRRKIDWHIVPVMFLCYTMQFLDKVNINVSHKFNIALSDKCN
jgi:hypothetical protein